MNKQPSFLYPLKLNDINLQTIISCYFIHALDTRKRICQKTMIDTVLVESAEMIQAWKLDKRKLSYAVLGVQNKSSKLRSVRFEYKKRIAESRCVGTKTKMSWSNYDSVSPSTAAASPSSITKKLKSVIARRQRLLSYLAMFSSRITHLGRENKRFCRISKTTTWIQKAAARVKTPPKVRTKTNLY